MDIEGILARLVVRHQRGDIYDVLCPAHPDNKPSMTVSKGDHGGVVVSCKVGCTFEQIATAMGLTSRDFQGEPHVVAEYKYTDAAGQWLYSIQRWHPKDFRAVPGLPALAGRVLYNMPCVRWCHMTDSTIYVVEGEKDVDLLSSVGIPSTCNVGGAGPSKWLVQYTEALRGLNVVVIADNDEPGKAHARNIAKQLKGVAKFVTVVASPHGKDVSDLLSAGYSIDALQLLPDNERGTTYKASGVAERKVAWAWRDHFPAGKISLIEGDPGDGKSIMTCDLVARWTTGMPMPGEDLALPPMNCAMISAEDDMDDTIKPRLRLAGANLERVTLIPHGASPDIPFDLGVDLGWLEEEIIEQDIKILVIDPLTAFLPDKTDSHSDHSVRRTLQPLKMLASRTGCTILLVRHFKKAEGGKALYKGGGSIAFVGAARAAFAVYLNPDDPDERILACVKANLSRKPKSISYTVQISDDEVPYIKWGEIVEWTAQQAADGVSKKTANPTAAEDELNGRRKVRAAAHAFLVDQLGQGDATWKEILEAAKAAGFSGGTLQRARDECPLIGPMYGERGRADTTWHLTVSYLEEAICSYPHEFAAQAVPQKAELLDKSSPDGDSPSTGNPDGQSDDDRDLALAALPAVCSICKATENVNAYGKPYWVWRCTPHNPRRYLGGEA